MAYTTNIGFNPNASEIADSINYLLANVGTGGYLKVPTSYQDIPIGAIFLGQIKSSTDILFGGIVDSTVVTVKSSDGVTIQNPVPKGTYRFLGGIGNVGNNFSLMVRVS